MLFTITVCFLWHQNKKSWKHGIRSKLIFPKKVIQRKNHNSHSMKVKHVILSWMCTVLAQLLVRNSSVLVYLTTLNFILDFNFFYQRNRYLAVINNGMSVYERLQFFWIISLKVVRNCHKDGSFLTPKKVMIWMH